MNQSCRTTLTGLARAVGVALVVYVVWLTSITDARAGVIVAAVSEMSQGSRSEPPAAPATPAVSDLEQASLLLSSTNTGGGAGSQSPTFGPGAGLVALVSEGPATTPKTLVSRLFLFGRLSLPSPLEDRFFRPPRLCN